MRLTWSRGPIPAEYSERIITKFLWYPVWIYNHHTRSTDLRWLSTVKMRQMYIYGLESSFWLTVEFMEN